jgi:hypothetical protein
MGNDNQKPDENIRHSQESGPSRPNQPGQQHGQPGQQHGGQQQGQPRNPIPAGNSSNPDRR